LLLIACGTALAATYFSHKSKVVGENKTEAQRLDLSQWPADLPFDRDQMMSFQSLFKQWEVPYKNQEDVCQQAQAQGLRCMKGQGNLSSIMKLDRPAVLKLYDDQGKEYYVALTGIKGKTATIQVGDESRNVILKEVEKRWLGDYTLLWRTSPNYRGDIHPGMKGPDVHWLDTQLAIIQGRSARTGKAFTFDNQLVSQVKKFQLTEGLVPDGIVGPQTIIHLNTAAGSKAPKLVHQQGET
jgi:general secretion pathway protein A